MLSTRKSTLYIAFAMFAIIAFETTGHSQAETGRITGTVLDPSGAVVPNVIVTVKSAATGLERQTTSTSAGTYAMTNLQPGRYTVSAQAPGFATVEQITDVGVGAAVGVDIHLTVGGVTAAVEITEAPVGLVNTEIQTLSQTVTGQEVLMLPTMTRNPYDLVQTVGNVSDSDPGGRGTQVAVNGLRSASTNLLLDGVSNTNDFDTTVGIKVPLDSVGEFSVVTSGFTAEYGRASGGVVNVATRTGSNDFHGTAYEFNRLSGLASNTFDNNANNTTKPVFTRNQFGFSGGGPIIKDKLFFFENTEFTRVRSSQTVTAVIPTSQLIAASAPNTQQFFQNFGKPRSNLTYLQTFSRGAVCTTGACTAIPAATPIYQKVSYGVPSDSGGGTPQNTYALAGRVDYNIGSKDQIFFRIAGYHGDFITGSQTNSPFDGYDTPDLKRDWGYVLSQTHTFSSSLVSQTKLSFSRITELQPLGTALIGPRLFTTLNTTSQLGNAPIVYPGYFSNTPSGAIPFGGPQNTAIIYEDMSWIHGKHSVRFGGLHQYIRDNRAFGAYEEAVGALGTNSNNAVNGLVTGQLHDFQVAVYPQGKYPCVAGIVTPACTLTLPLGLPDFTRSNRYHESALYVQDAWKMIPRLTINLGLRWEYFGPPQNKDPNKDSNFYPGAGANEMQRIGNGQESIASQSPVHGTWAKEWTDYAPRVGFAWDVRGDGKTSLRGGYGISYERNFGNVTFNMMFNPPLYAIPSLQAGVDVPTIPISSDNLGPFAGNVGTKPLAATTLRAVDPHIKTAYAHQWGFSVEHELQSGFVVGMDYSGSRGDQLYTIDRVNISGSNKFYGPGPVASTSRINPQYSAFNFRTNGGNSIYHGLNTRIETRNLRNTGLTLRANYTWSHSIDTSSATFGVDNAGFLNYGALDPLNRNLDRGDSDYDVRHRLALSAVWAEPYFSKRGLMNLVAGGWNVAPIFTAHTGSPFTIFDSTNAGDGALIPRAMFDKVFHPAYTQTKTGNPNEFAYLDLTPGAPDSSYVNPLVGHSSFGPFPATMSGRNVFRTPGLWRFNLGLYKDFAVTEAVKLQFRAESYNVFNHSNMYIVYSNLDVGSFAGAPVVTATRGIRNDSTFLGTLSAENNRIENRNFQFAMKVIF